MDGLQRQVQVPPHNKPPGHRFAHRAGRPSASCWSCEGGRSLDHRPSKPTPLRRPCPVLSKARHVHALADCCPSYEQLCGRLFPEQGSVRGLWGLEWRPWENRCTEPSASGRHSCTRTPGALRQEQQAASKEATWEGRQTHHEAPGPRACSARAGETRVCDSSGSGHQGAMHLVCNTGRTKQLGPCVPPHTAASRRGNGYQFQHAHAVHLPSRNGWNACSTGGVQVSARREDLTVQQHQSVTSVCWRTPT